MTLSIGSAECKTRPIDTIAVLQPQKTHLRTAVLFNKTPFFANCLQNHSKRG